MSSKGDKNWLRKKYKESSLKVHNKSTINCTEMRDNVIMLSKYPISEISPNITKFERKGAFCFHVAGINGQRHCKWQQKHLCSFVQKNMADVLGTKRDRSTYVGMLDAVICCSWRSLLMMILNFDILFLKMQNDFCHFWLQYTRTALTKKTW